MTGLMCCTYFQGLAWVGGDIEAGQQAGSLVLERVADCGHVEPLVCVVHRYAAADRSQQFAAAGYRGADLQQRGSTFLCELIELFIIEACSKPLKVHGSRADDAG